MSRLLKPRKKALESEQTLPTVIRKFSIWSRKFKQSLITARKLWLNFSSSTIKWIWWVRLLWKSKKRSWGASSWILSLTLSKKSGRFCKCSEVASSWTTLWLHSLTILLLRLSDRSRSKSKLISVPIWMKGFTRKTKKSWRKQSAALTLMSSEQLTRRC